MTTKTPGPQYPFITKAQIKERLASESAFRISCLVLLYKKQTAHEQATKSTLNRNKVGFMSSHAVHGTRIAEKVMAGEKLTTEDQDRIDAIVPRYTRQLAGFLREEQMVRNPELAKHAALFSVSVPAMATAPVTTVTTETATEEVPDAPPSGELEVDQDGGEMEDDQESDGELEA